MNHSSVMQKSLVAVTGAACIAIASTIMTAAPGAALTIGAPGDVNTGNSFPFGSSNGNRYQQVYNSNLFSSALDIDFVSFFNTQFNPGGGVIDTATYNVYLSNTTKTVNGLDTTNFNDNIGSNQSLFFSGVLGGPIGGTKFTIAGNRFTYDPSKGNLLLDITKSGSSNNGAVFLDANNGTFGNDSSRAHNFGAGFDSFGLVTEFDSKPTTSVPTPALLPGLIGLGFGVLRKRKAEAAKQTREV